jgi:hypothetical protein
MLSLYISEILPAAEYILFADTCHRAYFINIMGRKGLKGR